MIKQQSDHMLDYKFFYSSNSDFIYIGTASEFFGASSLRPSIFYGKTKFTAPESCLYLSETSQYGQQITGGFPISFPDPTLSVQVTITIFHDTLNANLFFLASSGFTVPSCPCSYDCLLIPPWLADQTVEKKDSPLLWGFKFKQTTPGCPSPTISIVDATSPPDQLPFFFIEDNERIYLDTESPDLEFKTYELYVMAAIPPYASVSTNLVKLTVTEV